MTNVPSGNYSEDEVRYCQCGSVNQQPAINCTVTGGEFANLVQVSSCSMYAHFVCVLVVLLRRTVHNCYLTHSLLNYLRDDS